MTDATPTTPTRTLPRRLPNTTYRQREYLTKIEVDRLIEAARKRGRNGPRDACAILLVRHSSSTNLLTMATTRDRWHIISGIAICSEQRGILRWHLIGLHRFCRINARLEETTMRTTDFRQAAILLSFLLLASESASAASVTGSSALALASVVAEHSTELKLYHKSIMARLFNGEFEVPFSANKKISVEADAIVCRASNVDITARSCRLTFGAARADLTGRKAHELYATIAEVGVPSEGAAGTMYEGLSHLVCTIHPHEIAQKGGSGADCTFDARASPSAKTNP